MAAVRGKVATADRGRMSLEGFEALSARDIPQPQRVVIRATDDVAAVRGKVATADRGLMSLEGSEALSAGDIPQPQRVVK